MDCTDEKDVYYILEESIANSEDVIYFLSGYRFLYTSTEVWKAIVEFFKLYGDVPDIKSYIERFIIHWFSYHIRDFMNNRELVNSIFAFIKTKFNEDFNRKVKTIFIEGISKGKENFYINIPPKTDLFGPRLEYNLIFNEKEVSDVLYSINVNLFKNLPLAPEIVNSESKTAIVNFSNHITYHVASHILSPNTAKQRARELIFFIRVAKNLRTALNYDVLFAIYMGLTCGPIQKLGRTWRKVPNKEMKYKEELDNLFDSRNFYGNYKTEIRNLDENKIYIPMSNVFFHLIDCTIVNKNYHIVKIIGKQLFQLCKIRKIVIGEIENKYLLSNIFIPSLSIEKLTEFGYLRENVKINGETSTSESSSEPDEYPSWSYSESDVNEEMSPRPFGTPRSNSSSPRKQVKIRDYLTLRRSSSLKRSKLHKTKSFYNELPEGYPLNLSNSANINTKDIISKKSPRGRSNSIDMNATKRNRIDKRPSIITRDPCIKNLKLPPQGENIYEIDTEEWTIHHVFKWLQDNDMDHYSTVFMGNNVDGRKLISLRRSNLIKLGIDSKKDRKKILKEIAILKEG